MHRFEKMDRIHICDLLLTCVIGVNEAERRERQNVCLNITLYSDIRDAAASDDLARTIDYKELKLAIKALLDTTPFLLLERLAESVASLCLREARVESVRVRVGKPGALRWSRTVEVEIWREKTKIR